MNIQLFHTLDNKQLYLDKDNNGREIIIVYVDNCHVGGISLYYPNTLIYHRSQSNGTVKKYQAGAYILPVYEQTMSLKRGSVYEDRSDNGIMSYDPYPMKERYNCVEDPVFFFIYNTDNYFHFLYDTLPYLISYQHLKQTVPNLKLLMNYPRPSQTCHYVFVVEFLDLLGITHKDIVIADPDHHYSRVYISSSYTHDGMSNTAPRREIFEFYQQMVNRATSLINRTKWPSYPENIYISRRTWIHNDISNIGTNYTTRRRMMNEDQLVDTLVSKHGFTEIFGEQLSIIEKIMIFHNAKQVIGSIGGGVANIVFGNPDETQLCTIVSPGFLEINSRFKFSLDWVKTIYMSDTSLDNVVKGFSKYMRVQIDWPESRYHGLIGEIEELGDQTNYLTMVGVKLGDKTQTGWNSTDMFSIVKFNTGCLIKMDEGLNSPYWTDIDKLLIRVH